MEFFLWLAVLFAAFAGEDDQLPRECTVRRGGAMCLPAIEE